MVYAGWGPLQEYIRGDVKLVSMLRHPVSYTINATVCYSPAASHKSALIANAYYNCHATVASCMLAGADGVNSEDFQYS